jgi:ABC-2 type transport system ATP-binding protein
VTAAADPALASEATVVVEDLSVWFGQKVAVSELTCSFGPGVTGLLGPNGAGKTTLMRAITGTLPPNQGRVRVLGLDPRADRMAHRHIALVPEDDAVPVGLTARQLVRYTASLHGQRDPAGVEAALEAVDLAPVAGRRLGGFSKGMRQRARIAAALATGPSILVLDEPLNGADPVQRAALIELFVRLGAEGRTVIVSSHVLHEVERLAQRQIVLVAGRLAAAGDRLAIRAAMADRPRRIQVRADDPRRLAGALVGLEAVVGLSIDDELLHVSATSAAEFALALPKLARDRRVRLLDVRPLDESLESVFREVVR